MAVKKDVVEQSLIEPQNSFSSETITEQDIIKKKNILSKEEFDTKARALSEDMKVYNKMREQSLLAFEESKKKKLNEFLSKVTPLIENFVKEN